jgi:hypothetical protein
MTYKKKLTEVALSLEEIKVAYAREVQPAWASFMLYKTIHLKNGFGIFPRNN